MKRRKRKKDVMHIEARFLLISVEVGALVQVDPLKMSFVTGIFRYYVGKNYMM